MSQLEATTERFRHDNTQPSRIDRNTEDDRPIWMIQPPEVRFDAFNRAVCLDIRRTYAQDKSRFIESHERNDCDLEADLLKHALMEDGDNSTTILICLRSRDASPSEGMLPLPMTEKEYMKLAERYNFSPLVFKVFDTGLATVRRYSSGEREHWVFQQDAMARSSLSMIICYDVPKRSTMALVFAKSEHEPNKFLDILLESGRTPHWSALPLAALELTVDFLSTRIKGTSEFVSRVRESLKMDIWTPHEDKFDVKSLNLIAAIRLMNSALVELAYISQVCQTSHSLLGDIEIMVESDLVGSESQPTRIIKAVKEDIQHLKRSYDGIQARSDFLTRYAEALLQTAYSLISQRDSAINLEIAQRSGQVAKQSMDIAQLSRKDNLAMREVAIAAAKDSATMRVIAAVTLFFLPPTFVATFFSASFLDFKPTRPGDHMSNWIWLYFVLTITLIAVVMGFWRLSTRHALKNIPSSS